MSDLKFVIEYFDLFQIYYLYSINEINKNVIFTVIYNFSNNNPPGCSRT